MKCRRSPLRCVCIVQARMGATRFFGKSLKTVLDKPLLKFLIDRLQRAKAIDQIAIATTEDPRDDILVDHVKKWHIPVFRGSEQDVLTRFKNAANQFNADTIVRITADCPLIDPNLIDQIVNYYIEHASSYDYVSNTLERTYPRGMDVEVFSKKALDVAAAQAKSPAEREHVTLYLYHHPELFKLANIRSKEDNSNYRWTVDTPEDFALISKMIEAVYPRKPNFTLADLLELIKMHPDWNAINAHIEQKKV